jgi:hypothetical protein
MQKKQDDLDWLRAVRNKHYEETKKMSLAEKKEYYRKKCEKAYENFEKRRENRK